VGFNLRLPIIGAVAGIWGAYTAYDASKFKQPFDIHDKTVNSFHSQIASAEARKDTAEIVRIRLSYEKFEEDWRSARYWGHVIGVTHYWGQASKLIS
jgi:hypothetical protein